jgi:hypothetical protein
VSSPDGAKAAALSKSPTSNPCGAVIALDAASAMPARFLAHGLGRAFIQRETLDDCLARPARCDGPALLVGLRDQFSVCNCDRIEAWCPSGWGFLTASDEPGLSFVVAKQLAPSLRSDWATVDIPGRHLHRDGPLGEECELTPGALSELLVRPWHGLAIRAHGEGGHVNLESTVLCGVPGEAETGGDGRPIAGCTAGAAGRRCKRAPDPATRVLGFGELKADELHLMTCASSLMCGELYPSDISATLSLAEGYARSALLNNRIVQIPSAMVDWVIAQRRDGAGPWAICEALNGLQQRATDERPYLWFGDPVGAPIAWQRVAPGGAVAASSAHPAVAIELGCADGKTLNLGPLAPGSSAERGVTQLIAWQADAQDPAPRLYDATADLEELDRWLGELGHRRAAAADVEFGIAWLYPDKINRTPELADGLNLLREIRLSVDAAAFRTGQLSDASRVAGLLEPGLAAARDELSELICLWDRHYATVMAKHLFGGPCYLISSQGLVRDSVKSGGPCDHCGAETRLVTMRSRQASREGVRRHECSLCGGKGSWPDTGARLSVTRHSALYAGLPATLEISFGQAPAVEPASLHPGVTVVHAQDKALRVFFRRVTGVADDPLQFEVTPPDDIAPELQTLHVALIRGMRSEVIRHRWPVLTR